MAEKGVTARVSSSTMLIVALVCAVASAQDGSKTDFDQKIDAAKIAADIGSRNLEPISPIAIELQKIVPLASFAVGKHGTVHSQEYGLSHFQTQFLQQSAPVYGQLVHAQGDARYRALPQLKRQPLDAGFSSVQDERQRIVDSAVQLDNRDQGLKNDSDYIRTNQPLLEERKRTVNADIAAWNRDCGSSSHPNGLPPAQYQECMRRDSILRPMRDQFNREMEAMNARVIAYNANYQQMGKDVGTASDWWSSWGDRATKLLDRIFASFAGRKVECIFVAKSTGGLCIYNCDEIGITNLMPDLEDGGCSKKREIDPDDLGGGGGIMNAQEKSHEKSK